MLKFGKTKTRNWEKAQILQQCFSKLNSKELEVKTFPYFFFRFIWFISTILILLKRQEKPQKYFSYIWNKFLNMFTVYQFLIRFWY